MKEFHAIKLRNSYKNIRTGETYVDNTMIDNDEYKLLNPKYYKIDNQDDIKKKLDLPKYRTHGDPWNTNFNSLDNYILGSYSRNELTNMIENTKNKYDYILFLRPDCLYLDKFDLNYLNLVNDYSIVIPDFHLYGKYNINDRFAITNSKTYKIYGKIFLNLLEISKKQRLHSETILGYILEINKINAERVKFDFSRIRFNGEKHDFKNRK